MYLCADDIVIRSVGGNALGKFAKVFLQSVLNYITLVQITL